MEAVECGAAALSILLRYYGRYLPLEVLRLDCGVSRDGSNAFNLLQAAKKYGLSCQGFQKSVEELTEGPFPAILLWRHNHFLVLEGFSKQKVYLNDPASGPRTVSYEDFARDYSGVVLTFEKTASFVKGGKPAPLFSLLYQRLKDVPKPLFFLFLTGMLLLLPGFAMPAFLMAFINTFFSGKTVIWDWDFLGVVFATALTAGLLHWMRWFYLNRLSSYLSLNFSSQFLWHLLKLPINFYNQRYSGEIAYRTSLNDSIANTLANTLLSAAIDLLLVFFYAVLMFTYDASIAWIGIAAAACNLGVMLLIYRSRENSYARLQQHIGKSVQQSIGGIQAIETIKSKGAESDFFAKWAGHYTNMLNDRQEIGKKDVILSTVPPFFQLIAAACLLWLGSLRVIEGTLSVGRLMALQLLMMNFLQPIYRFVGLSQLIQNMKIDLDRLSDVLKNPIDSMYQEKKRKLPASTVRLEGRLEFRNVTFGYSPLASPLIENLSFVIQPGKRLALVGPTGCGKSTIAKLATGLFRAWSGQILYDDIPIEEIPKEILCNSVATVDQEIFLFSGTIRDNLTLWNPQLPDTVLIAAAKDACIHEEILMRPGNYDSLLIEGGRNLSGGQRQRLEIARALLYNSPLLILDEATSALDSKVEKEISDQIILRGCSLLMIAHRISTIQDCHEILVLEQGKVIQRGTHAQLKVEAGVYRELIRNELSE